MTPISYRPPLDLDLDLYRDQRECSLGIANLDFVPAVTREIALRRAVVLGTAGLAGICITGILAYLGAG